MTGDFFIQLSQRTGIEGEKENVYKENTLFKKNKFIYLFMAGLGLRCCTRAFSNCGEQGLLFVAVHGLLIVVASLVAEQGL